LGTEARFYERLADVGERAAKRPPINIRGGRPQEPITIVADYLANRIAEDYELLTGKRATAGTSDRVFDERNEFEQLLGEVYANLGIAASAEVQARKLARSTRPTEKFITGRKPKVNEPG
jgi:hypothetical protein